MTVPAFSVSAVLPGAPIPSKGTGVATTTTMGGLFDSLLAGLDGEASGGQTSTTGSSSMSGSAIDPLGLDRLASDAADSTQTADLAMQMFAPVAAPTPFVSPPVEGAAPATGTSTRGRIGSFNAHSRAPATALAFGPETFATASTSSLAAEPIPAAGVSTSFGAAPVSVATPDAARPAKPAEVSALAQTTPPDPKAYAVLSGRPTASPTAADPPPPPAPASGPVQPGSQVQLQAQARPQTPTQPAVSAAPPTPQATVPSATAPAVAATVIPAPAQAGVVEALAAADAAPAARVAPPEGETRRTAGGRAGHHADAAGRRGVGPPVDISARQAVLAAAAEGAVTAIDGDAAASPTADAADLDLADAPEARLPSLPAEVRAQAAQRAEVAAETATARSSAETVARLAADIVRKADGQSTRFDLQLDPHGLGKVDVALEIDRNGKLTAALSFDSAQSAADLRSRAGELRLALEQAGFDIAEGGLTFDLSGQGPGFNGREAGQQQDRAWNGRAFQRAQAGAEEADLSLASTPSTLSPWTRSGVDIRI